MLFLPPSMTRSKNFKRAETPMQKIKFGSDVTLLWKEF